MPGTVFRILYTVLQGTQKLMMEQNHNNFRSSINSEGMGSGKSPKLNGSKISIKNCFIESVLWL